MNTAIDFCCNLKSSHNYFSELDWPRIADEQSEVEAERQLVTSGKYSSHVDHCHPNNPEVERAFRKGFLQSCNEALAAIECDSIEPCDAIATIYDQDRIAAKNRKTVLKRLNVGKHYDLFPTGSEIAIAEARGLCHGRLAAVHLAEAAERVGAITLADGQDEPTDDQWNESQAKQRKFINDYLPAYRHWVKSVKRWANDDCQEVEIQEFFFELYSESQSSPGTVTNDTTETTVSKIVHLVDDDETDLDESLSVQSRVDKSGFPTECSRPAKGTGTTQQNEGMLPALTIRTSRELIQTFPKLRPVVVDGLLRQGETMNLVGAPKIGKSWMTLSFGLDVVTGRKVFDRYWATRGKVLIIDNELHPNTSALRVADVAAAKQIPREDYLDQLYFAHLRGALVDLKQLALELRRIPPGEFSLIILDAWYRFLPVGSDENSNADVTALYNLLDSVADLTGSAFACVHHSSKGNQAGKSVTDTGSGAGSQSRAADCHLVMRQHAVNGAVVVDAAVRSFKPIEPFCLRWDFPAFRLAEDLNPKDLKQERPSRGNKSTGGTGASPEESRKRVDEERRSRLLEAYRIYPDGETAKVIRESAGMSGTIFGPINTEFMKQGLVTACKVTKNGRQENGFKFVSVDSRDWLDNTTKIIPSPASPGGVGVGGGTTAPPLGAVSCPTTDPSRDGTSSKQSNLSVQSSLDFDAISKAFEGSKA